MAQQYQNILSLYEKTIGEIAVPERWMDFLRTAGYNFRLPFDEQVLIYAQRPDARAVLPSITWNDRFGRGLMKGAKGIVVIDKTESAYRLRHYFDYSDTRILDQNKMNRAVPLWRVQRSDETSILKALQAAFSVKEDNDPVLAVMEICRHMDVNIPAAMDEKQRVIDYSHLFRSSVGQLVTSRLMEGQATFFNNEDFSGIETFDSLETMTALGIKVCQEASEILSPIAKAVRHSHARGSVVPEIPKTYNEVKIENERGEDNERDVSQNGWADGAGFDVADDGIARGQVRFPAIEIPDGGGVSRVPEPADDRTVGSASGGSARDSNPAFSSYDGGNGQGNGSERSAEVSSPVGMDQQDERDQTKRRGSDPERTDLPINVAEREAENSLSAFLLGERGTEELGDSAISSDSGINFELSDTEEEAGKLGPKERFKRNIEAIAVLKACRMDEREATPREKGILSQYIGWGGLADAFDQNKTDWRQEYQRLKRELTEEEYRKARASTLTAFYTPSYIVDSIYQGLMNFGFEGGTILDPCCGTGRFFDGIPSSMKKSQLYAVEIDPLSAGIAQLLHPEATVLNMGYENARLSDESFDVAVGNVPFGDFRVVDPRYDFRKFQIHDYFFEKTLDMLKPGGIMAFITSKGTLDKKDTMFRDYISKRAELIGAIRLPNTVFKDETGARVTTDIIFLKKLSEINHDGPGWVWTDKNSQGIMVNTYFLLHPEMILGTMAVVMGPHGPETTCKASEEPLQNQLDCAIARLNGTFGLTEQMETEEMEPVLPTIMPLVIETNSQVRNFSYFLKKERIYFRENDNARLCELNTTETDRITRMIDLREITRALIEAQLQNAPDDTITALQQDLKKAYTSFVHVHGRINARNNRRVLEEDSSYPLLCSLEILDDEGRFNHEADFFTQRTISPENTIIQVDTADEALAVSLSEKGCVDLKYMASLLDNDKTPEDCIKDLKGIIFKDPGTGLLSDEEKRLAGWQTADEYLSGDVRDKLSKAREAAERDPFFLNNVQALQAIIPKDLDASEITVRLGTTWIPAKDIEGFIYDLLETPMHVRWNMSVIFNSYTADWRVKGKSLDNGNVKANSTFGTYRKNAYAIIEDTLNLKDVRIFDYVEDDDGHKRAVLNQNETTIALAKQDQIKQAFKDWIWKDPVRRQRLTAYYNEHFNNLRLRTYDGSHLRFPGINPEIKLRPHQQDAVARIIYGGNTLLAHVVGAGKTYTMVAAAMEMKRIGLCHKSMVVVPNHIIPQFASDWLTLFPAARLLVTTKKDFQMQNRKKFCARIATGEYDAVIIGHSQFEKIPLSKEKQIDFLQEQVDEIVEGIEELKRHNGERITIKQLEGTRKKLEVRMQKLNDQHGKDDVLTFEELGIDRLFVDEADNFKNLYAYSKMRNVGGIAQTEAKKASDLFMKTRYLDEITGGKGVIFATGTPISNSMVEMYTMQRYLQNQALRKLNLRHFDAWASTFGETVTALELSPEGTNYRMKTRFSRFYNIPELMTLFRQVADIKTADMLKLPVPKVEYRVIKTKPSQFQKELLLGLSERADKVRNRMVDVKVDNMLCITNDGRKLALDQRLMDEILPDEEETKVNACVDEVYRIYHQGDKQKLTQLIFCDLSTPKNDQSFNVYDDIRKKLVKKGIPRWEIAFIHTANSDEKKKELFSKVRKGSIRILMGSTAKMGAGTNVQDRLIASHDLDCPWRPRDLEQRAGRIIRQGNQNERVEVIRYITEGTFDAYSYQLIENKQHFISQIMTGKSIARSAEDIDSTELTYAEIKALATGNPLIKEKMALDNTVSKLRILKQSYQKDQFRLQDKVNVFYPREEQAVRQRIANLKDDLATVQKNRSQEEKKPTPMFIGGTLYNERKDMAEALFKRIEEKKKPEEEAIGSYFGLEMCLRYDRFDSRFVIVLKGQGKYRVPMGDSANGNLIRLDNAVNSMEGSIGNLNNELLEMQKQKESAHEALNKPFEKEQELNESLSRLSELNAILSVDVKVLESDEQRNEQVHQPYEYGLDRCESAR